MVSSAPALLETNGWLEGGALDWELKESWETSWRKRGRSSRKTEEKGEGERDRKREKERKRKRERERERE